MMSVSWEKLVAEQTLLLMFQQGLLYVTSTDLEVVAPLDVDFDDLERQTDWVNDENIVSWEVPRA